MRRGQNIYHRKDGRWEGRCYIKGSRKYRSVYGRTCSEVKEKLQRLASEDLVPSRKCSLRFSDIMQMWLANRKTAVKITSYYCYKHKLDKHILPYFGVRQYSTVIAANLEQFKLDMLSKRYSDKYVADMVVMIKSAAKYAAEVHNYADPFAHVQPPKVKRREAVLLSEQQQKAFIKYCANSKSLTGVCCFLTMFTGLRIGELCALKWDNIDIENSVLHMPTAIKAAASLKQKRPKLNGMSIKWKEFLTLSDGKSFEPVEIDCEAMTLIMYTGGSTGTPKGVMLSNISSNSYHFNLSYTNNCKLTKYEKLGSYLSWNP